MALYEVAILEKPTKKESVPMSVKMWPKQCLRATRWRIDFLSPP